MTTPSASAAKMEETAAASIAGLAQAMEDLSGQTLGDFKLLRKLGSGGMGQVYLAEQSSLRRRVAVKLLRAELNSNEKFRKRFETEAKAAAQLSHPSIVQVHAVGEHDGLMFMALEYVEGWTLKDYLLRKGPPELTIALSIMRQVAAALARAAELGIVHRDIKPENILLTRKVEVKVTDFGLAKILAGMENENLTQTGVSMGTPLYMSPEQVQGLPLDPRSDIYCFGATCYHMLCGQPPFTAESAIALAFKHVQEHPVPLEKLRPDLPPELCQAVGKMMAKKPEERYQSAREILRDLKKLADGGRTTGIPQGPVATLPVPPGDPKAPAGETTIDYFDTAPVARRRWPWIIGGSVMGAILFGVLIGLMLRGDREPPADTAGAATSSATSSKAAPTPIQPHRPPPLNRSQAQRREHKLLEDIERTKDVAPGDRMRQQVEEGTRHRVDLLYFYLEETPGAPDLEQVRAFLARMSDSPVPQYRMLSGLGHGILLSYRPDVAHSAINRFQEVVNARGIVPALGNPAVALVRRTDRELAELIVEALDRCKKNIEAAEKKEFVPPQEVRQLYDAAKDKLNGPRRPRRFGPER